MRYLNIIITALSLGWATTAVCADWKIVGDTTEWQIPFTPLDDDGKEFVYVGGMSADAFKITDGTTMYLHACGSNNPLGDSITLREAGVDERGLCIRYAGKEDMFRLTLSVDGDVKSLKAERVEHPRNLYIHGGPFNLDAGDWQIQDAVLLTTDPERPYVFWYKGDLHYNEIGAEGGSFKLLQKHDWGDNYHPEGTGNVSLSEAIGKPLKMRLNGEDSKWTIPADHSGDGYYEIEVDVVNLTLTVTKFVPGEARYPRAVFAVGAALPCGWPLDNTTAMQMDSVEDGVYEWAGYVTEGDFKFTMRHGSYGRCWVSTVENQPVFSGEEYDVVYEENYFAGGDAHDYKFVITQEGISKLRLDLTKMKFTVEGQPSAEPSQVDVVKEEHVICYSREGRLFLMADCDERMRMNIFSVDGRRVAGGVFVRATDVELPAGSYIVVLEKGSGEPPVRLQAYVR